MLVIIMICLTMGSSFATDGLRPEVPYPECHQSSECPSAGCYQGYCDPENLNCYLVLRCV